MPPNRRPQDREAKREEILAVAAGRFTDDGYEAASMGQIAKDAGITVNTIYWYFADKDDLLIAVLDRLLAEALEQYATKAVQPAEERLLWVVERLRHFQRLVNTVHTRATTSPAVDAWHTRFHQLADTLITGEFAGAGAGAADVAARATIATFVIEGLLTHPLAETEQRAVITALLAGLTHDRPPVRSGTP